VHSNSRLRKKKKSTPGQHVGRQEESQPIKIAQAGTVARSPVREFADVEL
jgi:hypothetical protein